MSNDEILFFDFNQKSATLLIFFFNALIFSVVLLKRGISEDQQDSKWLAAFIFLCGLYVCPFMLGYAGWYSITSYREFMFFMPFQQLFLLGPVLYFYVRSLFDKNFSFTNRQLWHFLPALLYLIYSFIVFITDKFILDRFYFYADERDKDLVFWYQMAGLLSMLGYLGLCLFRYKNYRKDLEQEVSYAEEVSFKWVKNFLLAFSLILFLRVLFFILNPEWAQFGRKYWYYLSFSAVGMYITIEGYTHALKVRLPQRVSSDSLLENSETQSPERDIPVSAEELHVLKEEIESLMNSKQLHTNPRLTLSDLALELNTNRNRISEVINQGFGLNFNEYINARRIETVLDKLKSGEHLEKTLLGIALDCGFNSKSTFNRAFKKHTKLTPQQFITKNNL
ncbi:helix-turn-helix domain-containing protein [Leeuwenhoekiella parthenopeia]|uniref:AraC family transcriptional regulator n=1 Tax=Leeuwenhoekiella parthenopeia TaxID=2890320 RepID=A0ABS8GQN2_9FLAO|nr:AraC family transcriptional regulator [Leeuwenhoekiella parthenopeia]MCC4212028.1 AraC family transcriptional regulator [Leeuwenhoekiella parthenopeia]